MHVYNWTYICIHLDIPTCSIENKTTCTLWFNVSQVNHTSHLQHYKDGEIRHNSLQTRAANMWLGRPVTSPSKISIFQDITDYGIRYFAAISVELSGISNASEFGDVVHVTGIGVRCRSTQNVLHRSLIGPAPPDAADTERYMSQRDCHRPLNWAAGMVSRQVRQMSFQEDHGLVVE